jgi:two-component sensor histidine kinase
MKEFVDQTTQVRLLARSIIGAIREPLLVVDENFKVLFASSSFHRSFQIGQEETHGQQLFRLDGGAWDIPSLRILLEQQLPERSAIDGLEIAHDFPRVGRRVLLLHVSKACHENSRGIIVLGIEDVTERRDIEREKAELQAQTNDLLRQKEMLLAEMEHRIRNSLQIISSILMLKARAVTSEEARQQLQDAHRRVLSVAAVQQHLHSSGRSELIEVAPYLSKLCGSLGESMIGESRPAMLKVLADDGSLLSGQAVSLGLIVTELVINALKHAFPEAQSSDTVVVRYEVNGANWRLSVLDNGGGSTGSTGKGGLGTSIVKALARQLDAQIETSSGPDGMSVSIVHSTFILKLSEAA